MDHQHPMPGMPDMPSGNSTEMMHMMSPYIFTSTTDFFVLFKSAFITSTGGFVGALFACFFYSLFSTLLSFFLKLTESTCLNDASRLNEDRKQQQSNADQNNSRRSLSPGYYAFSFSVGSISHAFRLASHYFSMLLVMTMNLWIILVVVAGHGVGFLIILLLLAYPPKWSLFEKSSPQDPQSKVHTVECQEEWDESNVTQQVQASDTDGKNNRHTCQCDAIECGCDPKICNQSLTNCSCESCGANQSLKKHTVQHSDCCS